MPHFPVRCVSCDGVDGVDDALQLVMKSHNKNFRHASEKTRCCMNDFKFDVIASAMIMDELINRSWKNVKLVIYNDGLHLSAWQFLPNVFCENNESLWENPNYTLNLHRFYTHHWHLVDCPGPWLYQSCDSAHQQQIKRLLTLSWGRESRVGIRERLV